MKDYPNPIEQPNHKHQIFKKVFSLKI